MTGPRRSTAAATAAAVLGVLLAAVVTGLVALLAPTSASAASYRYWTYWWGSGTGSNHGTSWRFASQGPAFHGVGDRWVLGWRFATTSVAGGAKPRTSASYDALCPGTAAPAAGTVRVALVVDYGTLSDAPPGQRPPLDGKVQLQCLTVPADAHGSTVLEDATPSIAVRSENGLVCALQGYPRSECAPIVADPTPSPTRASPRPTSSRSASSAAGGSSTAPSPRGSSSSSSPTLAVTGAHATPSAPDGSPPDGSPVTAAPLPVVSDAPLASDSGSSSSSPSGPLPFVGGVLLVAVLGGGAWWSARSRGGGR